MFFVVADFSCAQLNTFWYLDQVIFLIKVQISPVADIVLLAVLGR